MTKPAFRAERPRVWQLRRAIWLLAQLADGSPLHLDEAAVQLGVSPRTVRRDARFLEDALQGRPRVRVRSSRVYLDRRGSRNWPVMSSGRVLQLLSDLLARRDPASLRQLLELLEQHVTVSDVQTLGQTLKGLLVLGTPATATEADTLSHCLEAVRTGRALWVRYARGEELTERVIEPWDVTFAKEAIYLLGFCRLRQALREFRLDRMQECRLLDELVAVPPDRGRSQWESAFGTEIGSHVFTVVVRFDAAVAYRVKGRNWHATQRFEPLPDGGAIFRAEVSSRIEVVRWVLSYGPYAELLEPADLRQKLREQLAAAGQRYDLESGMEEESS